MENFINPINNSNFFIYLDLSLINGLSSVYLNGYIQKTGLKLIKDNTVVGRLDSRFKNHTQNDVTKIKQITENSKINTKNRLRVCHEDNDHGKGIEGRGNIRVEESIETIYTTFTLHRQLMTEMSSFNLIKANVTRDNIHLNHFTVGDYIELCGEISCISIVCYLDYLITLLNSFNTCEGSSKNTLNDLLKDNNPGILNYTAIANILSRFKELLCTNGTEDLIVMCGDTPVILTVYTSYFLENTAHMLDKANCKCRILGKVIKHGCNRDEVNLIRKTGHPDYYEGFLNTIQPYLRILRNNGLYIPDPPPTKFGCDTLFMVPLSIYL